MFRFSNHIFTVSGFYRKDFPFLLILLLLSGDVERNPGPDINDHYDLSVLHLNIRSLRNKLSFIDTFCSDFDILCFTETHLDDSIGNESLTIPGFSTIMRKDRNAHGGGVIIYFSDALKASREREFEPVSLENIWAKVTCHNRSIMIGLFYIPPNTNNIFYHDFEWSLESVCERYSDVLILGDFNVDMIRPNTDLEVLTTFYNFQNVISEPTRVTAQTSTLLDPVFISPNISRLDSGVLPVDPTISDHKATFLNLSFSYNCNTSYKRLVWNYKRADYSSFNDQLEAVDWEVLICNAPNVDTATDNFTNTFLEIAGRCIPNSEVIIRPSDKPWFDSVLRKHCRIRDRLKQQANRSKRPGDWIKYKNMRNRVNNMKKHAKEKFYENLETRIDETKNENPRGFWHILQSFLSVPSKPLPPLNFTKSGEPEVAYTDQEKVNVLNNYFTSISRVDETNVNLPEFLVKCPNSLTDITIEESDVIDIISVLN